MKIENLTLSAVDAMSETAVSMDIVAAAAYAARRGWGDGTCHRFVSALVATETLLRPAMWPVVFRRLEALRVAADLAALDIGQTVTGDLP